MLKTKKINSYSLDSVVVMSSIDFVTGRSVGGALEVRAASCN